jgi:hypothetical protein
MNKLTRIIDRQTFVDGIARTANSTLSTVFFEEKKPNAKLQTVIGQGYQTTPTDN